jgi:non-specific serine/threonine protein kinase
VREEPGQPLLQTLGAALAGKRMLLVFDNCEQVVKPAADLAHALLRAAPGVGILASSREALRVPGEQVVPILPLPVPGHGERLEALASLTAVRLFVARAQSHKPSFELNEREAPAVAQLVRRLEGIPLALELAAARVRSMSVADINKRLADRYKVLTGGSRVLHERQQTLRALVDWSYELLRPEEQKLFNRLAVFAGGFDLPAAEAVCGVDPLDPFDVMDQLASLVEKSLVMMEERTEGSRYRMLETLRDYARDKLAQDGDDEGATAARHCEHFFGVAKQVRDGLLGGEQGPWLMLAETELDNLRAAMASARVGHGDVAIAAKLPMALQNFWLLRGHVSEGRAAVKSALALPAILASDRYHAWALYIGASLATGQNDHAEARDMLELNLSLVRRLGNPAEVASTLSTLALARLQGGDAAAAMDSEREALQIFEQIGHRQGQLIGHLHIGQSAAHMGDDAQAVESLKRGLALARELERPDIEAECCFELGTLACQTGDATAARAWLSDALRLSEASGDRRGEACAMWGLAEVDLLAGDADTARSGLYLALHAFREFEMREHVVDCLEALARLAMLEHAHGDALGPRRALALSSAVAQMRLRWKLERSTRAEVRWQALLGVLQQALGEGFDPTLAAMPETGSKDDVIERALAEPAFSA